MSFLQRPDRNWNTSFRHHSWWEINPLSSLDCCRVLREILEKRKRKRGIISISYTSTSSASPVPSPRPPGGCPSPLWLHHLAQHFLWAAKSSAWSISVENTIRNISHIYHSLGKMFGNCWPEKMLQCCCAAQIQGSRSQIFQLNNFPLWNSNLVESNSFPPMPSCCFPLSTSGTQDFLPAQVPGLPCLQQPGCLQYLLWESPEQLPGKFWKAQISSFFKWNLFIFLFWKCRTSSICFWAGTVVL